MVIDKNEQNAVQNLNCAIRVFWSLSINYKKLYICEINKPMQYTRSFYCVLMIFFVMLTAESLRAQSKKNVKSLDSVYTSCDTMPVFKTGWDGFSCFLARNIRYPEDAENAKVEGKVSISFIVEKDGSVSQARIIKGVIKSIDDEAIRVISTSSGKWKPGIRDKKKVRALLTIPIQFRIDPYIPPHCY